MNVIAAGLVLCALVSTSGGKMYLSIGKDGTPVVTDYPRNDAVTYAPGDFEKIAMREQNVPHRGLGNVGAEEPGFGGPPVVIELHEGHTQNASPSSSSQSSSQSIASVPPEIEKLIAKASAKYNVPASLVRAVIAVESAFRVDAVSHVGAQGLMQLMPDTAADLGVKNAFDPEENVMAGTRYLAFLLKHFGDESLAVAAYNAGPARVAREGAVPDIPETRAYVASVLGLRQAYGGMLRK